ncbi:MAG: hypothetical protein KF774_15320 [Planctomyces sp.]|nr:hypothetical protein [Planctomyces sp.]
MSLVSLRSGAAALLMLAAAGLAASAANGDTTPNEARGLAADLVWLQGGGELRGAVLEASAEGDLLVAVRRDWLKAESPRLYEREAEREKERSHEVDEQLLTRLDEWIALREEDRSLFAAISAERRRCRERLDGKARAAEPPEFCLIELPADDVRRVQRQTPDRRRLAVFAWRERLKNVETSSATKLVADAKAKSADWATVEADLSDRLPPLPQSDAEWRRRVALWEYVFREPCDLQGTGEVFVRTDSAAERPDVAALIAPIFQSTLKSQLADLLEPGLGAAPQPSRWRETAVRMAEQAEVLACRVTRLETNIERLSGQVATEFLVREDAASRQWTTLWKEERMIDPSQVTQKRVDALRDDPQVKQLLTTLAGFGVEGQLDQALRFGAAVEIAQQESAAAFQAYRDRYTRDLRTPPLRTAEMP